VTRNANQIAEEHARREKSYGKGWSSSPPKANTGTLKIYNSLGDDNYVLSAWNHVTVEVTTNPLVINNPDGSKDVVYPDRGWFVTFEPDDAGE
jgi:hypothetical protein